MADQLLVPRLDRRGFLKAGAALGGGLVIGLALPLALGPAWAAAASPGFAPNAFIRIDRQGAVTLVMPMVEMGQGTYTALPMLLAEELEVGLDQVRLEHAPPNDALYANSLLHIQTTGLSASIRRPRASTSGKRRRAWRSSCSRFTCPPGSGDGTCCRGSSARPASPRWRSG
jgi:CO/xanthine dehydrogenase Mo-binding subunit